jgi:hypothetical protein
MIGTTSTSVGDRALLWCWLCGLLKVEVIAAEGCDKISLKYDYFASFGWFTG